MFKNLNEKETKLIYQLFIGKVSDELGFEKTIELLKESKKQIKDIENE